MGIRPHRLESALAGLLTVLAVAGPALAQEPAPEDDRSFWDYVIDSEDGWPDVSEAIRSGYGALPFPIVVTEPALGVGGGLGMLYIHRRDGEAPGMQRAPNSLSMFGAARTSNGSWFAGGAHRFYSETDKYRYLGFVGGGELNLDFYGIAGAAAVDPGGVNFESKVLATYHEGAVRIEDSPVLVGAGYGVGGIELSSARLDELPIPSAGHDVVMAGFSAFLRYDTLDNQLTPRNGQDFELRTILFDEPIGSDFDFTRNRISWSGFHEVHDRVVVSGRAVNESVFGDVPFFAVPFIMMRGIPALRYQGDVVLTAEFETRVDLSRRFRAVGFGGVGVAAEGWDFVSDTDRHWAYGVGVRYLTARLYGFETGVDLAFGPEDTTLYFIAGTAW